MNSTSKSPVRVTGFTIPPWADMDLSSGPEGFRITGLNGFLLEYVGTSLNFWFQFVKPVAFEYGKKNTNGSWTGVLGMLQRNEVDIVAPPTVTMPDRMDAVRFTSSFWHTHTVLLTGKPYGYSSQPFAYLMAFKFQVWALLALTLVVLAFFVSVSERRMMGDLARRSTFGRHAWSFMGIVSYQSSLYMPLRPEGKVLFSLWCLDIMILMNIFSGTMKARLTAQGDPQRIDCLADLLSYPQVRPLVPERSAISAYFEDLIRSNVWKQVLNTKGAIPGTQLFVETNMEDTFYGRSVIVNELNIVMYRLGDSCSGREYYVARETFLPMSFTFAIGKHLPDSLVEDINVRILRFFDTSHLQYHMRQTYYRVLACLPEKWVRPDMAMDMKSMYPVFLLWAIGSSIACFALVLEVLWRPFGWLLTVCRRVLCGARCTRRRHVDSRKG